MRGRSFVNVKHALPAPFWHWAGKGRQTNPNIVYLHASLLLVRHYGPGLEICVHGLYEDYTYYGFVRQVSWYSYSRLRGENKPYHNTHETAALQRGILTHLVGIRRVYVASHICVLSMVGLDGRGGRSMGSSPSHLCASERPQPTTRPQH